MFCALKKRAQIAQLRDLYIPFFFFFHIELLWTLDYLSYIRFSSLKNTSVLRCPKLVEMQVARITT